MPEAVSSNPIEILQSMGGVGLAVLVFLLLMSLVSITAMVDRWRHFARARRQSLDFVQAARPLLEAGRLDDALAEARKHPASHLALVSIAAIQDFNDARAKGLPPATFAETTRHAFEREATRVTQEMKRGLALLASIGATAPFVGLFGTVIGIMNAFFGMARAGQGGIGAVAGGIAEALVNTAVGLFVALPAVWAYNYYLSRIERFAVEMSSTGGELVDLFVKNQGQTAWKSAATTR